MASFEIEKVLEEIGLTPGEIKVYLALLKLGQSNVHQLKRETGIHRTTIYDFLEGLGNKGLVSSLVEKGKHVYSAAHPRELFEVLENKKAFLTEVFDDLVKVTKHEKQDIKVEVYRGKEGLKKQLREALKSKSKEILIFGLDERKYQEHVPIEMKQYFRQEKERGIKERLITWEDAPFVYDYSHITYRYIPKQFFNPTPTVIVDHTVFIQIWDPLTSIVIKSKELSASYRNHFELLWKLAKPFPVLRKVK